MEKDFADSKFHRHSFTKIEYGKQNHRTKKLGNKIAAGIINY